MQKFQEETRRQEEDFRRFREFEASDQTGIGHDELLYMSRHHDIVDVGKSRHSSTINSADLD